MATRIETCAACQHKHAVYTCDVCGNPCDGRLGIRFTNSSHECKVLCDTHFNAIAEILKLTHEERRNAGQVVPI